MRKMLGKRWWTKVLAVALALALNMGTMDGLIRLVMQEWAPGTFDGFLSLAAADPGDGSFSPTVFDPNHDETSTLTFRFDYDHNVRIDLLKGGQVIKTLDDKAFYRGDYTDPESKMAGQESRDITNHYTWDGKDDNGEPMDDGSYSIKMTPLDEWSEYPLIADVRVRNIPHTPVIRKVSINQGTGTITIYGTSQPNHTIHLYDNGNYFFTTTADANGNWWAYNKTFTKEVRHTINAKAENKVRKWPTLSALSESKVFLAYQVKAGDNLWIIANFYLKTGTKVDEIKSSTGLSSTVIHSGNWLLVMNPLREGPFNDPGKIESSIQDKENGVPQKPVGDPMNPVTGNYFTQQTDMVIPGRGMSFEFTRTYNSQSDYRGHLGVPLGL